MARTAIVTGGGSGIGRALCRAIADRGAHVVVADLDDGAAATVAHDLGRTTPGTAEAATLDVADADAVEELVARTHRDRGRLDLLCNNAGIPIAGPPDELTLDHWRRALDVNLRGVLHGCHAAYPRMLEQGSGHIVNTASLAGLIPGSGATGPYATSKHAVVGLSLAWRAAALDHGVHVHVVCPGFVDTPILDRVEFDGLTTPPSMVGSDLRRSLRDAGVRTLYDPAALAEDVLRGVARDDAVIVAPASARAVWRLARAAPGLAMRAALHGTRLARREAEARRGTSAS